MRIRNKAGHHFFRFILRTAVLSIFLFNSCEYEFVESPVTDSGTPVSFSEDILPLLTDNANCTACHRNGSKKPYFTADEAYGSIVPALIDTVHPEESRFYVVPNPVSSEHSFKKFSLSEAALVLSWIQQGAKNN